MSGDEVPVVWLDELGATVMKSVDHARRIVQTSAGWDVIPAAFMGCSAKGREVWPGARSRRPAGQSTEFEGREQPTSR